MPFTKWSHLGPHFLYDLISRHSYQVPSISEDHVSGVSLNGRKPEHLTPTSQLIDGEYRISSIAFLAKCTWQNQMWNTALETKKATSLTSGNLEGWSASKTLN